MLPKIYYAYCPAHKECFVRYLYMALSIVQTEFRHCIHCFYTGY